MAEQMDAAESDDGHSVRATDPGTPAAAKVWHHGLHVLPGGSTMPTVSTIGEEIIDAELVEDRPDTESGADYGAAHRGSL